MRAGRAALSPAASSGSGPGPSTPSTHRERRGEGIISDRTNVTSAHCAACSARVVNLRERVRGVVPLEKAYVGVVVDIDGKECRAV